MVTDDDFDKETVFISEGDNEGEDRAKGFGFYTAKKKRPYQEDTLCRFPLETNKLQKIDVIEKTLKQTYQTLSKEVEDHDIKAGTTASVTVYDGTSTLITATAGDSSTFLAVYYKKTLLAVLRLNSVTHKPCNPDEFARITKLEGFVDYNGYVQGRLAITRAIGDYFVRSHKGDKLISPDPQIDTLNLEQYLCAIGHRDKINEVTCFIIATSDGFTDGAGIARQSKSDHEDYLTTCLKGFAITHEGEIAKVLATKANNSGDNTTVIVQRLILTQGFLLGSFDGHIDSRVSRYVAKLIQRTFTTTYDQFVKEALEPKKESFNREDEQGGFLSFSY